MVTTEMMEKILSSTLLKFKILVLIILIKINEEKNIDRIIQKFS
jgi:hypothetical protein